MKKLKKLAAVFMALVMVISLLPSYVSATGLTTPQGPLGGKLKIAGTAAVDNTLRADFSEVTPAGLDESKGYLTYLWTKVTDDKKVKELSREESYTLKEDDLGDVITLTVEGTGAVTGKLSVSTDKVAEKGKVTPVPSVTPEPTSPAPTSTPVPTEAPKDYSMAIIGESSFDFGTLKEGYAVPEKKTLQIQNTGNVGFDLSVESSEYFTVTGYENVTLEPGQSADIAIGVKEGLTEGSYQDSITIQNPQKSLEFQAFVIIEKDEEPVTYTIETLPEVIGFADIEEGYGKDDLEPAKEITITNTGTGKVVLQQPVSQYFEVGTLSKTELEPQENASFTLQPKVGMQPDTYYEEIQISTDTEASSLVKASYTVNKKETPEEPVYDFTVEQSEYVLEAVTEGYTEEDIAEVKQNIVITNTGNQTLEFESPSSKNFDLILPESMKAEPGKSITLSVQPKQGLAAGQYSDNIVLKDTQNKCSKVVVIKLVVKKPQAVYQVSVDPETLDFGAQEKGYDNLKAQTVTITNTGNQDIHLGKVKAANFKVSSVDGTIVKPGKKAEFTVIPVKGLDVGVYKEDITVENQENVVIKTATSFQVKEKAVPQEVLKSITQPSEIKGLKNGIEKSAKAFGLPSQVEIKTTQGTKKADVEWNVKDCGYDPASVEAQSFTVSGKVILPKGVVNTDKVNLEVKVKVNVNKYEPRIARASDNKITGITEGSTLKLDKSQRVDFGASGAGMDNTNPRKGDVRYVPASWKISDVSGTWSKDPYTAAVKITKSGNFRISVTFERQEYDGNKWVKGGNSDTKSVSFKVQAYGKPGVKEAVKTGDDTPVGLWIGILAVAAICLIGILVYRRKKDHSSK